MVPTTSTEDVSPHTSSYHDSTAQQYNSCTNPGELEKEMREAILSVKRQTSPAHFHVPMDMLEQSHTPINSHLPALFPLVCILVTIVYLNYIITYFLSILLLSPYIQDT